jgi:Protein of unknown function (DUF2283)
MTPQLAYDEEHDVLYVLLDPQSDTEFVKHMTLAPPPSAGSKSKKGQQKGHIEVDFDAANRPIQFAVTNAMALFGGESLRRLDSINPDL